MLALALALALAAMACGSDSPTPDADAPGASAAEHGSGTHAAMEQSADAADATNTPDPNDSVTIPDFTATARTGQKVFAASCSVCHGVNAAGTGQGPPLVNRIYEPGHHPDFSIRNAVRNGVPQHHWVFGDMPPVAGVTDAEVEALTCYLRELQLANGIFERRAYAKRC